MSYITLSTGEVLQSEWDAKRVVASIVNGERDGKTWMPLNDGSYYRISHIVSVTDERADLDFGDVFDKMFGCKGGDAEWKIELFLDEGEEYPQLFSVWRVDQNTGRADLTTRRNYVDDRNWWDQCRKTDDENIRLNAENEKLRKLARDMMRYYFMPSAIDSKQRETELIERASELGVEEDSGELGMEVDV